MKKTQDCGLKTGKQVPNYSALRYFQKQSYRRYPPSSISLGFTHIVRTHKGGGEGSSQMRAIPYKGRWGFKVAYVRKKNFLDHKILKFFFFCTKEAITLPFILLCIEKCKQTL